MASNSILLLAIFLVVTTRVFSHDEDLKIVTSPAPAPPVKAPTPAPPVKSPSYPPVTTPTTPPSKVPPPQSPVVKPPTPTPTPAPPSQPPTVKPPTYPSPPVVSPPVAPSPPAPVVKSKKDCIPLCDYRCQLHSRKRLCMRACMTCCDRCKCVPPGTYGNREKCGKCYTDMLTHGNKYKCP
ncbi:gibberellin-regulated protein 14 [Cajanus cajan]|uniref:gibberellin-regulated protein 14 n=1 Tax=Cajanus cajan TaxID=3821 RepID=UPI00098D8B39|nr:gibberellin-regulated protein 14 [Cajanus cajan]